MNNGELKNRLRDLSARTDLDQHLQGFINTATDRLNRRFCKTYSDMAADTDTNPILAEDPDLYIYASMIELSHFIRDWEDHDRYNNRYIEETRNQEVLGGSSWQRASMYIKSESEQAAEDATV